jgi:hypothetical protein
MHYFQSVLVMKKSQINQAFTYIAVILVVGAIAVVGAKAIIGLFSADCESKSIEFKLKIEDLIIKNSELGTVSVESVRVACEVSKVCFISASAMKVTFTDNDPVIDDLVREGSYNVFSKGKFTEPIIKSSKLATVNDELVCIEAPRGVLKLRLTGQGRTTLLEGG